MSVRVSDRAQIQPWDPLKIVWVACVKRDTVSDCTRCDQCVVSACCRFSPRCAECRGNPTECSCAVGIERKHLKVCLGLLQMLLACTALIIAAGYVRADG